ncbi:hypothetical protein ACFSWE_06655 [Leucobacter albus]|uniref:Uncharacterized protein n=1 Tax=Leucobacter albus TaxID=272210 RepID=A0ABW3TMP5_9MICO
MNSTRGAAASATPKLPPIGASPIAGKWRQRPLWGRLWRIALFTLVAVVIWQALNHLIVWQWLHNGYFRPGLSSLIVSLALPTLYYTALAAVLQRWLVRFGPVAQALVFGGCAVAVAALFDALIWLPALSATLGQFAAGECGTGGTAVGCAEAVAHSLRAMLDGLLRVFAISSFGYGLALASLSARARWVYVVAIGVAAVLAALAIAGTLARANGAA